MEVLELSLLVLRKVFYPEQVRISARQLKIKMDLMGKARHILATVETIYFLMSP